MIFKKIITFFTMLFINESYQFTPSNLNTLKKVSHNNINNIKLLNNEDSYSILDTLLHTKLYNGKESGRFIVEQISSLLPKVDSIGHNVLHANNEFINYILEHNIFNDFTKKNIILLSIKMAQMGDNFGSDLLQLYYNIVDKCL